jgi:ElaB/YqjD/DUF883 family membrane-anchored ribosome-binding protein
MATSTQETGTSGGASGTTQEVVERVQETAQETAKDLRGRAPDRMRGQVQARSNQAGEQLTSIVEALRKGADHLQEEGNEKGAQAAHQAAEQTQKVAKYLKDSSADKLLGDVERAARSKPWLAAGIGAAAGFVASRFLKASSERRYRSSLPTIEADARPALPPPSTVAGEGSV